MVTNLIDVSWVKTVCDIISKNLVHTALTLSISQPRLFGPITSSYQLFFEYISAKVLVPLHCPYFMLSQPFLLVPLPNRCPYFEHISTKISGPFCPYLVYISAKVPLPAHTALLWVYLWQDFCDIAHLNQTALTFSGKVSVPLPPVKPCLIISISAVKIFFYPIAHSYWPCIERRGLV